MAQSAQNQLPTSDKDICRSGNLLSVKVTLYTSPEQQALPKRKKSQIQGKDSSTTYLKNTKEITDISVKHNNHTFSWLTTQHQILYWNRPLCSPLTKWQGFKLSQQISNAIYAKKIMKCKEIV